VNESLELEWRSNSGTRQKLKELVGDRDLALRDLLAAAEKSTDPEVTRAHARWEALSRVITNRFGEK